VVQDPLKWVKLVVPLTFGTTVDLGWDPTMQLKYDSRLTQYYYEMSVTPIDNPVTYRSGGNLSEFSADAIRVRATRVFEAYEINRDGQRVEGSNNVAIKDYWIDTSREAEPVILKKILKGATDSKKAKFLTVLVWEDMTTGGNVDRIMNDLNLGPRGHRVSEHAEPLKFYLCQYEPNQFNKRSAPRLAPSTGSNLTSSMARFDAKTHQRIVFKEVGHPIHDEESITTIFQAARDAAEGQCRQLVPQIKPHNNIL
jgi:hypothetical protein